MIVKCGLSWRYVFPSVFSQWFLHPMVSSGRLHWKNPYKKYTLWGKIASHFSGRISGMFYTVSGGLLEANLNQVNHCFNMRWKSKGYLLKRHLVWNLSLNSTVTHLSKWLLFQFKIMLTSFQSISITSQISFLFNLTFLKLMFL